MEQLTAKTTLLLKTGSLRLNDSSTYKNPAFYKVENNQIITIILRISLSIIIIHSGKDILTMKNIKIAQITTHTALASSYRSEYVAPYHDNIKIVHNSFFRTLQREFSNDKQAWLIGLLPVTPEQTPSPTPDIIDTYHRKSLELCTMPATPIM